jgi:hypothetical protein
MEFKNSKPLLQYANDPLQNFLYALKAPDSKKTVSSKTGILIFYEQAKKEPLWTQHQLMQYLKKMF